MTTTWGFGDYPAMAAVLLPVAKALVDVIEPRAGERVVDLACGTGNAAILAAQRGARVVGVDLEPALLEIAARRSADANLHVDWVEADAASPGLPKSQFNVVLSVFGIMYVADHRQAVHTMARLCRPGGMIAMTAWAPNGFMAALGRTLARYLPEPPAGTPPSRWGDKAYVTDLFAAERIYSVTSVRRSLPLKFEEAQEARDFLVSTAGHVIAERPRLVREGHWNDLLADLGALVRQSNRDPGLEVLLNLDYLLTLVQKPS
jgi:SAM-dependent methyltransferase